MKAARGVLSSELDGAVLNRPAEMSVSVEMVCGRVEGKEIERRCDVRCEGAHGELKRGKSSGTDGGRGGAIWASAAPGMGKSVTKSRRGAHWGGFWSCRERATKCFSVVKQSVDS